VINQLHHVPFESYANKNIKSMEQKQCVVLVKEIQSPQEGPDK